MPTEGAYDAALCAYAALYGRAERSLFGALVAGGTINTLKREFLVRFGMTARQFNAIRAGLDGKIDSIKERRPELIAEAETRIHQAQKVVTRLEKRCPGSNKRHQKKRRLHRLTTRLAALKADHRAGKVQRRSGRRDQCLSGRTCRVVASLQGARTSRRGALSITRHLS